MVKSESSYSVGLFWFSPDYSKIEDIQGERELTAAEVASKTRIDPVGLHADFDMPRNMPRGRLRYEDGMFTIFVGEDCEINPIPLVKEAFGLRNLDSSKFKVRRHYHWNTKS